MVDAMQKAHAEDAVFPIELVRIFRDEGRDEGRNEGRAEALRESLLTVLAERGLEVTDVERGRILRETSAERLGEWLRRAVTGVSTERVLED